MIGAVRPSAAISSRWDAGCRDPVGAIDGDGRRGRPRGAPACSHENSTSTRSVSTAAASESSVTPSRAGAATSRRHGERGMPGASERAHDAHVGRLAGEGDDAAFSAADGQALGDD